MSPNVLFWSKVNAGKLWHVKDASGKLLGMVSFNFDGWAGFVMADKKWPSDKRRINTRNLSTFWGARRLVEYELREQ